MPLDTGKQQLIMDTINRRLSPRSLLCPISGDSNWAVESYIAALPATDTPSQISIGHFPLAVITCTTCGYTHLVNLVELGLGDVLHLKAEPA